MVSYNSILCFSLNELTLLPTPLLAGTVKICNLRKVLDCPSPPVQPFDSNLLAMARRQAAAKTAIPGDNSTLAAELKGEEALSTSDSAIQAAGKEDTSHGDGMGTAPKKAYEQVAVPAGDPVAGKQEDSGTVDRCALGKRVDFILS